MVCTNEYGGYALARKSSGLPVAAIGVLIVLGALAEAIKNYWPSLLIVGGAGLAFWLYKKSASPPPKIPQISSDFSRVSAQPIHTIVETPSRSSPQPIVQDGDKLWIPEGKSVSVAGYLIENGLIYIGKGLLGGNGWQQEAALIDPSLPVDKQSDDYSVRNLNYWPSYAEATPKARAAYLNWLAKGKSDPQADMGYVFLYFYGLERRALVDVLHSEAAKEEVPTIIREVERLLTIYGDNGSFRHYANSFIDFLKADRMHAACLEAPPSLVRQGELTFSHRYCLGQISTSRKALSSEWAYVWLLGDPTTRLKTAAQRCPAEFKRAFVEQYSREFKEGMLLPQNKTRLKVSHSPASPSLGGGANLERRFELPDVTVLSSPMQKLQRIADTALAQLDSYSRYIGRNADKAQSADAMLELPFSLWPDQYRHPIEQLRATIEKAQKPLATKFEKLQGLFPDWHDANRQKYQSLSRALSEAGLGIEPDIKFGGKVPNADSPVVLFADDGIQANSEPTPEYSTAALTLHLAVSVSAADGDIAKEERHLLLRQLEAWMHLNVSAKRRLQAHFRLLTAQPPGLNSLKKRIEVLPLNARQALGEFLAQVAKADNEVTPAEVKLLEKIFKMLGLEAQLVYSMLHVVADAPVPVKTTGAASSGYSIPSPPKSKDAGIELDMGRIAALHAESERVSSILGAIFAEEPTQPETVPAPVDTEEAVQDSVMGLDADHSVLIRVLSTRPAWSREELEELAQDRGILLDGALERINEASFDKHDQPFSEGDDPVEINQEVVREILQ